MFFGDRSVKLAILEDSLSLPGSQGHVVFGDRGVGVTSLLAAWASRQPSQRIAVRHRIAGRESLNLESHMFQGLVDLYDAAGNLRGFRLGAVRDSLMNARQETFLYRQEVMENTRQMDWHVFSDRASLSLGGTVAAAGVIGPFALLVLPPLLALSYLGGMSTQTRSIRVPNPEAKRLLFNLYQRIGNEFRRLSSSTQGVVIFDFGDWSGPSEDLEGWFNDMTYFVGQVPAIHFVNLLNSTQKDRINREALISSAPVSISLEPFSEEEFSMIVEKRISSVTPRGDPRVNPLTREILAEIYRMAKGNTFGMLQLCNKCASYCVAHSAPLAKREWLSA